MDYRVIGTLGSVFSAYLVWFGYPISFVTDPSILHWTLLYLHSSYQSLTSFEPTYFIVLHDLIPFSCDQRRMQTSLELSGRVFTCLWTLGSTSSMMVGLVRLLMHLWWYTHIDSWDVVSWFAYISDLESWSTFVWSIILVLLCQHSFGDIWFCFIICSFRLCIVFFIASSLSISQSILFGDILCLLLVTILHWGITPSSGSSNVLQTFLTTRSIS